MTAAIAIFGLGLSGFGSIRCPGDDGEMKLLCPILAGCGMAAFLGAACGAVL